MEPWKLSGEVFSRCFVCDKESPLSECAFIPQSLCKECYQKHLNLLPKSKVTYEITLIADGVNLTVKTKED